MFQNNHFPSDLCIKTCYAIMTKSDQLLSICLEDDKFDINEHFPSMFSSDDNFLAYAVNYDYDYALNRLLKNEKLILNTIDKHRLYQLLKQKGKYRSLYHAVKHLTQENDPSIEYIKCLLLPPSTHQKNNKVKKK